MFGFPDCRSRSPERHIIAVLTNRRYIGTYCSVIRSMHHKGMERLRDQGESLVVNGRSRTRNDIGSGISRY